MTKNEKIFGLLLLVLGLLASVFVDSPVWLTTLNVFFYYTLLAISYNVIFGYSGLFSFCHPALGLVGGYASAILVQQLGISPLFGPVIGFVAAGVAGLAIGLLILRVRGFYLCLVTWAFGMVLDNIIKTEYQLTGGTGGMMTPTFFQGPNASLYAYFVGLVLLMLMYLVSALLFHSRWGLNLFAIRDDMDAAESLGIRTRFWKVFGFTFGSAWAGVAGAYYAHFFSLIEPGLGSIDEVGKVCLMVIVGGLGTVYGPILGAFFVVIMSELIRGWVAEYSLLIYALVMILVVRFVRGGFMEIITRIVTRIKTKFAV